MESAPSWVLQNAVFRGHENNWCAANEEEQESLVPRDSKAISLHTLFKIRTHEDDRLEMKAQFVLHGNRGKTKELDLKRLCSRIHDHISLGDQL